MADWQERHAKSGAVTISFSGTGQTDDEFHASWAAWLERAESERRRLRAITLALYAMTFFIGLFLRVPLALIAGVGAAITHLVSTLREERLKEIVEEKARQATGKTACSIEISSTKVSFESELISPRAVAIASSDTFDAEGRLCLRCVDGGRLLLPASLGREKDRLLAARLTELLADARAHQRVSEANRSNYRGERVLETDAPSSSDVSKRRGQA